MLSALLILAVTQAPAQHSVSVLNTGAVVTSHDMSVHKRHELHLAHLAYLHSLHIQHVRRERHRSDAAPVIVTSRHVASGTFTCSGLEHLWVSAGGNPSAAFIAAEIAEAESGGRSDAISPTDDYGLWQINASHGSLATLDPYGNARAAILISDNGSDWLPWTTYRTGAYIGRC